MDHLSKDKNFVTTRQAIKKDHPEVAEAMDRMADCVSAAYEIVSSQLDNRMGDPTIIVPMALEIFRDSKDTEKKEDGIFCSEDMTPNHEDKNDE